MSKRPSQRVVESGLGCDTTDNRRSPPSMVRRWTALGVVTAQKEFRRIKGYRHMGALVHALRSKQKFFDSDEFAA